MSNFLLLVKRLRDAALDLYHATERRHVPVGKSDLLSLVEDWGRLDSAYRSAHLELISLKAENEAMRNQIDRLLAHCPDGECATCGEIICPHGGAMHFHHDGCPSCAQAEQELQ